jgi:16S rRNA (uracil1498-N3)-methyltransferase
MAALHRFFVDSSPATDEVLALGDAERRHARVLRLERGAAVELFDGRGGSWEATVADAARDRLEVHVGARRPPPASESPLTLTVVQGLCRGSRMDEVVRHGTELGVACFVPVRCHRSTRRDGNPERWRAIARDAARQSGRSVVPPVEPICDLDQFLSRAPAGLGLLLHPPVDGIPPLGALAVDSVSSASLVVGPEGGLEGGEVRAALEGGFRAVSLGPRILRTETAALAAVAALQARYGDLGAPRG